MKVLLLSRYSRLGASSRVRFFQYLPFLLSQGIGVTTSALLDDTYLSHLYTGRQINWIGVVRTYLRRIAELSHSKRYDLIWLEKELFPWLPSTFEKYLEWLGIPYMVDFDDAIFHRYDAHPNSLVRAFLGHKIDRVMRGASMVVVGNGYLAERARAAGAKRIELLPSVVDSEKYDIGRRSERAFFTIGWIGTPITAKYLSRLAPVLVQVCRKNQARVVAVGIDASTFDNMSVEARPWSEDNEVEQIHSFDVGIMPLPDDPWERGKCGYKLIQYMACGLPVIASPVGVNCEIVEQGKTGFLAATHADWLNALRILMNNRELTLELGRAGREKVRKQYCVRVTAPSLSGWMRELSRRAA